MTRFWRRLSLWFHSFGKEDDAITILIRTPEDGARVGMVGWY
jgi:hypothetical protein